MSWSCWRDLVWWTVSLCRHRWNSTSRSCVETLLGCASKSYRVLTTRGGPDVLSELLSGRMFCSEHFESTYGWSSSHSLDWCQESIEIYLGHSQPWVEIHCQEFETPWIYWCPLGWQCGGSQEHIWMLLHLGFWWARSRSRWLWAPLRPNTL